MVAIPAASRKKEAAWELVEFLTTDTETVVGLANAIHNVPSTLEALRSPKLNKDPNFLMFVDNAQHPDSTHDPANVDGDAYLWTLHDLGLDHQAGQVASLTTGLREADSRVDKTIADVRRSAWRN